MNINATFNNVTWSTTEFDDQFGSHIFTTAPNTLADGSTVTGGWGVGAARMGDISTTTWKCVLLNGDGGGSCIRWGVYANFATTEGSVIQLGSDSGLYSTGPAPSSFWSNDGTYMRIRTSVSGSGLVYKDGTTLFQPANSHTTFLEDTNGNTITCSVTNCTDTVGRVVNFNPNVNAPSSLTYLDSSNMLQTVSFAWQTFQLDAPWANGGTCSGVEPITCYTVDQTHSVSLITQITLPNHLSYSFDYVTTAPGVTTGQIARITLPTGGYIRYTYPCTSGTPCSNPTYSLAPSPEPWTSVTERFVSTDGSSSTEKQWSYSQGTSQSGIGTPFTITDPLGASQTTYFNNIICAPMPSQVDWRDSGGKLVQQVLNTVVYDSSAYSDPAPSPLTGQCDNPRITISAKVLSDTNQKSQTTFTYGAFGNITDQYEYDWGNGGIGSLLRHTSYQFQHNSNSAYGDLSAHILDRVTNKSICDGGGTFCSQTATSYDTTTIASTAANAVIQHDYTNHSYTSTVRGNPTVVSQFISSTAGNAVTTSYYNDVGNLIKVTDPNNNDTAFGYADNFANGV
ncbi:MAG TPA: hypothetical protein VH593_34060, partial [Ktedonobacteraceae bacterium]